MSELRIGLVGTGGIGKSHIERINTRLQGGRVVACADPAPAFGMAVAEKYGIKGFENYIDLIHDPEIDAIVCATGDGYHKTCVLEAIKAGKYIFCEKPLAPKADECKEIVEAELAAGKKYVQVGFMRRYDRGYRQLKAAVESGSVEAIEKVQKEIDELQAKAGEFTEEQKAKFNELTESFKAAKEEVVAKAKETADAAKEAGQGAVDAAKDKVNEATDAAKQAGKDAVDKAANKAKDLLK